MGLSSSALDASLTNAQRTVKTPCLRMPVVQLTCFPWHAAGFQCWGLCLQLVGCTHALG